MRPSKPRKTVKPVRTNLRVCETKGCLTKLSNQDTHVISVACLSPSHFGMPENKNPCQEWPTFDPSSYYNRRDRRAKLAESLPRDETTTQLEDGYISDSVASSEVSEWDQTGSWSRSMDGPSIRFWSSTQPQEQGQGESSRAACNPDPPCLPKIGFAQVPPTLAY